MAVELCSGGSSITLTAAQEDNIESKHTSAACIPDLSAMCGVG